MTAQPDPRDGGLPDRQDLLAYDEAAELAGVHPVTISRAIRDGYLHPVKFAGSARKWLHRAEVEAYKRGELRTGNARQQPRQPSAAATAEALRGSVTPDAIVQLVKHMLQGQRETIRDTVIDGQAAVIAGDATILATLLGGQGIQDPKRYAPSSSS